jgi:hypothetical protein
LRHFPSELLVARVWAACVQVCAADGPRYCKSGARDGIEPPTAGLFMAAVQITALRAKATARPVSSGFAIVVARDATE